MSQCGPEPRSKAELTSSILGPESLGRLAEDEVRNLAGVIERNVIPELVKAQERHFGRADAQADPSEFEEALNKAFPKVLNALMDYQLDEARRRILMLLKAGVPVQFIYLRLLAPVAQELGRMWEDDSLDFVGVTQALGALQLVLHQVGDHSVAEPKGYDQSRRIAIARAPNEQHFFGVIVVREFFRLGGWDVQGGIETEVGDGLLSMIEKEWFPLVGISVGGEVQVPKVAKALPAIREASKNRRIGILVGGPAFLANPTLFEAVGADGTAENAEQALEVAEEMLARAFQEP